MNPGFSRWRCACTFALAATSFGLFPARPAWAAPPAGTDRHITISEDTPYLFSAGDFGFADSDDNPPNLFTRVGISSLPAAGSLTIDGIPVEAGESVAFSLEARMAWTPRDSNRPWHAISSSADGTKLAAIINGQGPVYTSENSGASWTARSVNRNWTCLAISADGTKLAAGVSGGQIYTSSDSGLTWTARETDRSWYGIASSADGVRLAATDYHGSIYTSVDSGTTWTARAANTGWASIASSADGTKLAVTPSITNGFQIHTSSDSGLTWQPRGPVQTWLSVVSSADGSRLLARGNGCPLYRSIDSGLTWTVVAPDLNWSDLASSADGLKLTALSTNVLPSDSHGRIHTSSDGGVTWSPCELRRPWSCVASSADGLKLAAGVSSGKLYTSEASVPQLTFTPAINAFGPSYAGFTFQVQDDGPAGSSVDLSPNTLSISIDSVNDAPRLAIAITDGLATERASFNYTMQNNRFTDVEDGVNLTYSALKADGAPLPAWLSFDPTTRKFSGTPQSQDTGILSLTVIATDQATPPLSTGAPFRILVANLDDPPSGTDGAITLAPHSSYIFSPADFGFTDPLDIPANGFSRVKLTSVPASGILSVNGTPALPGTLVNLLPILSGELWIPRESSRVWYGITASSDGTRLAATANNGRIYTSGDSGVTWTPRDSVRSWYGIASSADGTKLAAVAGAGASDRIYISSDEGVNWTARGPITAWRSIASSADGTKLAAAASDVANNGGFIYTSADSGLTWTARANQRFWWSITSSEDGTKLAAAVNSGQIYTSIDSGVTWTPRETNRQWRTIASSGDGTRLVAVASNAPVLISTDSGVTWGPRETSRNWYAIASSADGLRLAATETNGKIHVSEDGGMTWIPRASNQDWRTVALSADGNHLAAGTVSGQIFTSIPFPASSLVFTPAHGGSGLPYSNFTFQVEDTGGPGANLDPTPNTFTLNVTSPFTAWAVENGVPPSPLADDGVHLLDFGFGLAAGGTTRGPIQMEAGTIKEHGLPALMRMESPLGHEFRVLHGRRKSGATSTVQFSADLTAWENSRIPAAVIADNGDIEACVTPFPAVLENGRPPRFFRVAVSSP